MRKGEAFLERVQSVDRHWEAIEQKVHPALLDMAEAFKECIQGLHALGPAAPKELITEIKARFDKELAEIQRRFPELGQNSESSFPCETIYQSALENENEVVIVAEQLHWERFKIPLREDVKKMEARDGEASRRVLRTASDYEGLRCENQRPKPFKGNVNHSQILGFGIGLGLENLTAAELAIFFDRFCPGCRDAHNAVALRRQRAEFLRAITASKTQ
jgi:hypothetical protein